VGEKKKVKKFIHLGTHSRIDIAGMVKFQAASNAARHPEMEKFDLLWAQVNSLIP